MKIDEYKAHYTLISGEYMAYVASADILMSTILGYYFCTESDKVKTLTGVFGNSVEFEKKRQILRRVIIDFPTLNSKYSNIHNLIYDHQNRRNKFAHCPLNLQVNVVDKKIKDLTEFQLLDFAKAKDVNDSDFWIYDLTKHEENKKSLGEMLVSLHDILETVMSRNDKKEE